MRNKNYLAPIKYVTVAVCCGILTSCANYKKASAGIDETQMQIQHLHEAAKAPAPAVVHKTGYYVDTKPISLNSLPKWMRQNVKLQAHQLPLSLLMQQLLRNTGIIANYDNSVQPDRLVSIHYSGTIAGALDRLAAKLDYAYQDEGNHINWSAYETKTFDISFMPGASNYLVGEMEGQNQNGQSSSGGNTGAAQSRLNDQQYSNMQGRLSIWEDLSKTLSQLKSDNGKVIVSESTTTVTVYDRPENVKAITNYIKQLNKKLSQEVAIKVCVLDVQLNDQSNMGINWNVIAKKVLGTNFNLTGNLSDATNLVANSLGGKSNGNSGVAGIRIGTDATNTLINALSQQGKVSVTTKPQVVTMNDQIASIRITQDTGYVQSVSTSFTPQYFSSSITPGNVTDGFTLYVLPKIQDSNVFMQISSTISNLTKLEKVSNRPDGVKDDSSQSQQYQSIQVPTISEKQFNQRSVVSSGSTLIIAGYKSLHNETKQAKLFGISALGGRGAARNNVETLVLITPIILKSTR